MHPGYKGSPEKWKKGEDPKPIGWYAGLQYDGDVARAKAVLAELGKHYPGARVYEVAGFCWWQGDRDSRSAALAGRYEKNLVHLIKQLRKDFLLGFSKGFPHLRRSLFFCKEDLVLKR